MKDGSRSNVWNNKERVIKIQNIGRRDSRGGRGGNTKRLRKRYMGRGGTGKMYVGEGTFFG